MKKRKLVNCVIRFNLIDLKNYLINELGKYNELWKYQELQKFISNLTIDEFELFVDFAKTKIAIKKEFILLDFLKDVVVNDVFEFCYKNNLDFMSVYSRKGE